MKIGIEAQRLFRTKKHGMDIVALELIKNIQQIDRENEYVVFVKPDKNDHVLTESENVKIHLIEGAYPFWEQIKLPKAAAKENCDLIHCTSITGPIVSKIPLILTLHDIVYLENLRFMKKGSTRYQKLGNLYRRWITPQVVKRSKSIITVSEYEKARIRDFFDIDEHDNRLVAIYNGVSSHFKPVTDDETRRTVIQKYNLPDRYLLFLGNTDPKKNTKGVLKAFANYVENAEDPLKLVIPDYDESTLNRLLGTIKKKEIRKHILLPGYIVNTDLPVIYTMAVIFLYPSLRESFGLPMLEAMACGTPVITSITSSMPEISGDAAKIVNPYKPQQIKDAIMELLKNPMLREKLIEKGYRRASKFTWRTMAYNVLKLYYNALNQKEK
ncbi:MAG: glycosyltransferase family 4 protein [Bacteroidales bacterium]|nr:glycosyltransferase family 4 protein [Bacteroidales bacterium]MCF8336523.1 glycosyltransferase family 4 protein [Bacteroidales bacterium]